MEQQSYTNPALLVIDMQVGLFQGGRTVHAAEQVLENVKLVLAKAHAAGVPVFAVRHTGPQGSPIEAGSRNWQIMPALEIDLARDTVFEKTRPSCFEGTDLLQQLRAKGIQELIICGLKTQYCIDTNCRAASELGFKVILVEDAHSCNDTELLPASTIIAHHNTTLQGLFASLVKTEDLHF
ncbi:cysteine hydrolase family protein [Undibacterium sp. JH2W]|uniref:cysteine hydrolase family protein n=1 Tax=Undibacterium sp. JH2W TaxID=3413037 RepID=UPI003BEFA1DC